jgi:hypothetical protein
MKTAEWIAALRSGKYKQGRQLLCKNEHFCCLGVLADISGVPKVKSRNDPQQEHTHETYVFELSGSIAPSYSMIPVPLWPTFLEDLDLSMMVPVPDQYGCDTLHNRLVKMNDDGFSFNEIANYIEDVYNSINEVKE